MSISVSGFAGGMPEIPTDYEAHSGPHKQPKRDSASFFWLLAEHSVICVSFSVGITITEAYAGKTSSTRYQVIFFFP